MARRCKICSSRTWHKEPTTGLITCSEGHVLENYRNELNETEFNTGHALKKRHIKKRRHKTKHHSGSNVYHGDRARYLYFQCLQLLLRHQIKALIKLWSLPERFESTCRELWALNIALLPNPPPAEPYNTKEDGPTANSDEPDTDAIVDTIGGVTISAGQSETEDATSGSSSEQGEESDSEDEDLREMMRAASEAPDIVEDDGTRQKVPTTTRSRKPKRIRHTYDTPAANVAILVVACWWMRIPVMYGDFIRAIEAHDLPYLTPERYLPENMKNFLSKYTCASLKPSWPPTPVFLHKLASRLARLLQANFGVAIPELNAAPLLWRAMCCLKAPPLLYNPIKALASTLQLTLVLHGSLAPILPQAKHYDSAKFETDSAIVELTLVSLVIIALKLHYGYDEQGSRQTSENYSIGMPPLAHHLESIRHQGTADDPSTRRLFCPSSAPSVHDWEEEDLDKYLDFCERVLCPEDVPSEGRINDLARTRTTSDKEVPDPGWIETVGATPAGQDYMIFHAQDLAGEFPEPFRAVLQVAADWVGVGADLVAESVETLERRLVRYVRKRTRR